MKEVLFVILEPYADWEAAHIAAALCDPEGCEQKYVVKTVSLDKKMVHSIGGFTVMPDYDLASAPEDFAAVLLIGGYSWRTPEAAPVAALVKHARAQGALVGAICGATVFLGMQGFLNEVRHTSNTLESLKAAAGEHYTGSISPSRAEYHPGDAVTVYYSITNLMETHTLMHMKMRVVMDNERFVLLYTGTNIDLGNLFPGQSKTSSFRLTFGEEYAGEIRISSTQEFTFLDAHYAESKALLTFTVASPEPDVQFSAVLHADETEVDAGDTVTLRIALGNTGGDAIGMFEVYTEGGALEATTENLPAGGSGSVTLTETIYETTTFRYVVTGTTGETSVSQETNAVTVTVRESETSESASTGEVETLAPPDASAEASQAEPATASETPVAATAASETAQPASASPGLFDMPYLLIWILALLVLIAIVVILMLMIKKKK